MKNTPAKPVKNPMVQSVSGVKQEMSNINSFSANAGPSVPPAPKGTTGRK
jgi:hypothetical protein